MIYEPREDSFLLNKYVRKYAHGKVLDMGTGTGIQAIAALENTDDVLATDINPECVDYAQKKGLKVVLSNLFEKIQETFDLIIFNPPYLPDDPIEPEDSKLSTTGGIEGPEIIARFLKEAKDHLNKNGKILLIISSLTGNPEVIFKDYKFTLLDEENFFFEKLFVYLLEKKDL
jgi:release factor glutamine methyltransferase